jgi:hypothetical protein
MGRRAAEVKTIAEAAKPFYASLDEIQKRNFAMLGREMLTAGAAQCGRIQREKPAARGCQRIGIGCNSHDVSALTGLFARACRESAKSGKDRPFGDSGRIAEGSGGRKRDVRNLARG